MKIGFANIFSFRPHVEHLIYLSALLKDAGHEVFFLTCDAGLSNCYPRALKSTTKIQECSKCIIGGVRSYSTQNITSLSSKPNNDGSLSDNVLESIALSSSCTLNRTESESEWDDPDVVAIRQSLLAPISVTYESALSWIKNNSLEGVICFNGRMDMLRAITYACEQAGIPYITHERTWFGDGLHLTPNANCLSIKAMGDMVEDFDNKPLNTAQALFAGRLVGERFLQRNTLEWRLYNKNPKAVSWPGQATGRKVLVLPSSKNEFAGHDEWRCGWTDNTQALDDFFEAFAISPQDVVVRFHPNWAENIGKVSGVRPLALYTDWASRKGIYYISSAEKANTYDLIQQADMVVMNGGSSAVEAGACGKQVICLGPSTYHKAGFVRVFNDKADLYRSSALVDIDPDAVVRKTLRYVYLRAKRFPQYCDYVKAIKTTKYAYNQGADAQRLIDMLMTGTLRPDDAGYADNSAEEDFVVDALNNRDWQQLADYMPPKIHSTPQLVQRRFALRWLDGLREKLQRGDR